MRLELTGRHITITPAIRTLVDQRLQPLLRMLNDNVVSVQVVLTKEKTRLHADVTVHARGEHFLHGEATGVNAGIAVGAAIDKIENQAQKLKSKWRERTRRGTAAKTASAGRAARNAPPPAEPRPAEVRANGERVRIIRARRYEVRAMSIDEAAIEVGDRGEPFLVFRNAATEAITVLFRRGDGHLGLIEPEA